MFVHTNTLVGGLIPGQKMTIEFPYTDMHITQIIPSCGCSEAKDHPEQNKVTVVYTAQEIPYQVRNLGKNSVTVKKDLEVRYYLDDPNHIQSVIISFTATVTGRVI